MRIEVLVDVKPSLGEGPLWDWRIDRLYFVDALGDRLYRSTADGREVRCWELGRHVGCVALCPNPAELLVVIESGVHVLDLVSGELTLFSNPENNDERTRYNDGKLDRQGRLVCGSMDRSERSPIGRLWRVSSDASRSAELLADGIVCSNGPCFSPDGRVLYFADSFEGAIRTYEYPQVGKPIRGRDLTQKSAASKGFPDGATVDADGNIWGASVYGGKLFQFSPSGEILQTLEMPVLKVTSVAFGSPDLDVLYVTSMAHPPLPQYPSDNELRGSVFAISGLGCRGIPEPVFGVVQ